MWKYQPQGPLNTFFMENENERLNIFSICFFYLKAQSFRLIMENNFFQMAASVQFLNTLSIVCSYISSMVSRIFSFKVSIVSDLSA